MSKKRRKKGKYHEAWKKERRLREKENQWIELLKAEYHIPNTQPFTPY